jgi:hypothetical protein
MLKGDVHRPGQRPFANNNQKSDNLNADNADSMIRVEGFPHVGPHSPNFKLPTVVPEA